MQQQIISAGDGWQGLDRWFLDNDLSSVLLVCGRSIEKQAVNAYFEAVQSRLGVRIVRFTDFEPNPRYESVVKGVALFRREGCRGLIAVGGGSALDVAKCIRLYAGLRGDGADGSFLTQRSVPAALPFLAMPTTAGTGSEATRYAVIYYKGEKQSVTDDGCIPGTVLMDSSVLKTLPDYQKKSTMLDALCHAMESFWSVNSTQESRAYSREALRLALENRAAYLANAEEGNAAMLRAANLAGRAINITQTTAGHAMCYKITSLFGCAHGHAAALCNRVLFPWMLENTQRCVDARGRAYLERTLDELGAAMGKRDAAEGAQSFAALFASLELEIPAASEAQFRELRGSVNPIRLRNFPLALDGETIDRLYHDILRTEQ